MKHKTIKDLLIWIFNEYGETLTIDEIMNYANKHKYDYVKWNKEQIELVPKGSIYGGLSNNSGNTISSISKTFKNTRRGEWRLR